MRTPSSFIIAGGIIVAAAVAPASAAAAVNYFDQTRVVTAYNTQYATCPAGWKVVGGGFELPRDFISSSATGTSYSYKSNVSRPTSQSWQASATKVTQTWQSIQGTWRTSYVTVAPAKVFATCVL
jgi:hypothetical protein